MLENVKQNELPTKCFSTRALLDIDAIVLHYISGVNVDKKNKYEMQTIYDLFVELNIPSMRGPLIKPHHGIPPDKKVFASAQLLVGRDGEVWQLVPFSRQSWHAGVSEYKGMTNLNAWSVGIEIIGEYNKPFEPIQYEVTAGLILDIQEKRNAYFTIERNLLTSGVIGHEHVAMPLGRKTDPGPTWDWEYLWDNLQV